MQSLAVLRGIIDIQAEEITRLMSLVEHLTVCLEQSQIREKAATQRCSELEMVAANQVASSSRCASEIFSSASNSSAIVTGASDTLNARSETLEFTLSFASDIVLFTLICTFRPPAVLIEVEELRKQIQEASLFSAAVTIHSRAFRFFLDPRCNFLC
jgi:hypothetical protein